MNLYAISYINFCDKVISTEFIEASSEVTAINRSSNASIQENIESYDNYCAVRGPKADSYIAGLRRHAVEEADFTFHVIEIPVIDMITVVEEFNGRSES